MRGMNDRGGGTRRVTMLVPDGDRPGSVRPVFVFCCRHVLLCILQVSLVMVRRARTEPVFHYCVRVLWPGGAGIAAAVTGPAVCFSESRSVCVRVTDSEQRLKHRLVHAARLLRLLQLLFRSALEQCGELIVSGTSMPHVSSEIRRIHSEHAARSRNSRSIAGGGTRTATPRRV
eukprot:1850270-Rhodomonas_salina.2